MPKFYALVLLVLRIVANYKGLCETHSAVDENDDSRLGFVTDSPYAIRQPHSLIDFLNQVEWVREKSVLQSIVKDQQKTIEFRYNDDDPELEKKIHETDENCLLSKPLDLQTENFVVTYALDLVPNFIYDINLNSELQVIASSLETLQIVSLEKLFLTDEASGRNLEPICQEYVSGNDVEDDEANLLPNVAEPELSNLSEEELQQMASFLTDRFEGKTQHLALYYSSFYWRIRGESRNAVKCLLRYLDNDRDSSPAKFQLGLLYIKLGKYQEAVDLLEFVTSRVSECGDCFLALGDAYVLTGNFSTAITAYEKAFNAKPELEIAHKKIALLKCVSKVFEVMERQHSNLLHTIDDVHDYKHGIKRLKELETLIEDNRANPMTRLQAKLAYEHYTAGPFPHMNCHGVTQKVLFLGNRKMNSVERLHCFVTDIEAFNASLIERSLKLIEAAFNAKKLSNLEEISSPTRSEAFSQEAQKFLRNSIVEYSDYLKKLSPYVAMDISEPQVNAKYPLSSTASSPFPFKSWTVEECERNYKFFAFNSLIDPFYLFLSPSNKGFIIADILTKYLALTTGELSPLPWALPYCGFMLDNETELDEIFQLESITEIINNEGIVYEIGGRKLKSILTSLADGDVEEDANNLDFNGSSLLLGDLGQRIATLLKYGIGAQWISLNLAALFFRYFGLYNESLTCLKAALQFPNNQYNDVALFQIAQILIHVSVTDMTNDPDNNVRNLLRINDAKIVLEKALSIDANEPLTHYLIGITHELGEELSLAESSYKKAISLDSELYAPRDALLRLQCARKLKQKDLSLYSTYKTTIINQYAPICCWPNEQNVYCFKQTHKKILSKNNIYGKIVDTKHNSNDLCFVFNTTFEPLHLSEFVYFRCNSPYTGKSYKPPGFAQFIKPLLKPAAKLRHLQMIHRLQASNSMNSKIHVEKQEKKAPVLPLDYGGYSEERLMQHRDKIPEFNVQDLRRFSIVFSNYSINGDEEIPNDTNSVSNGVVEMAALHQHNNDDENVYQFEEQSTTASSLRLPELSSVSDRIDVLKFDIPRLEKLPVPSKKLIELGKIHFPSPQLSELPSFCIGYKKNERILEQLASTYVSVTAKGIRIDDYLDLSTPISTIHVALRKNGDKQPEPVCPSPKTSKLLEEFDQLPAYKYRNQLKFYWPEKALRDALKTLGDTRQKMNMDEVAARLAYAMQSSDRHGQDGGVDWTLSTASTLYWRVKGDALNAIKCLRHSLNNSPHDMKDVALVSMANIYHQAGFLHSALLVGARALEISPASVVAIHFTLANIYVSMGDYANALNFYQSTLALQSGFQGARDRIRAIHCETNGKFLFLPTH